MQSDCLNLPSCTCVCLPAYQSGFLPAFVCLFDSLLNHLSSCMSAYLPVGLSTCHTHLSVYIPICLHTVPGGLSAYMLVFLPTELSSIYIHKDFHAVRGVYFLRSKKDRSVIDLTGSLYRVEEMLTVSFHMQALVIYTSTKMQSMPNCPWSRVIKRHNKTIETNGALSKIFSTENETFFTLGKPAIDFILLYHAICGMSHLVWVGSKQALTDQD